MTGLSGRNAIAFRRILLRVAESQGYSTVRESLRGSNIMVCPVCPQFSICSVKVALMDAAFAEQKATLFAGYSTKPQPLHAGNVLIDTNLLSD